MVLHMAPCPSRAWWDSVFARSLRYAQEQLGCASPSNMAVQGGRFVLISAAGLGLIRGCDFFTTSGLYAAAQL